MFSPSNGDKKPPVRPVYITDPTATANQRRVFSLFGLAGTRLSVQFPKAEDVTHPMAAANQRRVRETLASIRPVYVPDPMAVANQRRARKTLDSVSRPSGIHQTCVCNRSHGICKSKEPEEHWTESVNAYRTKSIRQTRIRNRSHGSWRWSEITWAALGNLVHIAYCTTIGQHPNTALHTGRTG